MRAASLSRSPGPHQVAFAYNPEHALAFVHDWHTAYAMIEHKLSNVPNRVVQRCRH